MIKGKKNISKRWLWGLFLCIAFLVVFFFFRDRNPVNDTSEPTQLVRVAPVVRENIPRYLWGIGTVSPMNTALVQSRVDGQLMAIHFTEGQEVKKGDLLVEIDPRPFEVQLQQAEGTLTKDMALLKEAKLSLERYRKLIKEESVSKQQLQAQESLVGQYEGAVLTDEANVADAKLQISYSKVIAPISGITGLRQVDVGSLIRSSDTNGIVRITQIKPAYVVFTLVEKDIHEVLEAMRDTSELNTADTEKALDRGLVVEAWDQERKRILSTGRLFTLDNQIDSSTGTVKAKAIFDNQNTALFPNQFVNVRLLVRNIEKALTIPSSALQRSSDGFFVYTVFNSTAKISPVTTGYSTDQTILIESGLSEGDIVVTDGVDRLRDNSKVRYQQ